MRVKMYGAARETEARYSPAECVGCGFTRLTNAFSKRLEHHVAAVSLHFMYYNFVRIHQTLRVTPAMAAGVTDHLWDMSEVVALLENWQQERVKEGQKHSQEATERSYNPFGPAL